MTRKLSNLLLLPLLPLPLALALGACGGGSGKADAAPQPDGQSPDMLSTTPTYTIETVDANESGAGTAMVYDSSGTAHLFYFGDQGTMNCNLNGETSQYDPAELFHAVKSGTTYTRLSVSGTTPTVANGVSAAIDTATGRPAVAFQGGTLGVDYCGGSDAMLGNFDGSKWTLTTLATKSTATGKVDNPNGAPGPVDLSGDVVGPWSALAYGPGGALYVAFEDIHFGFAVDDFNKGDLEFVFNTGAGLVTGDEVDDLGAGLYNSMGLDAQGRPVLAYSGYVAGGVTVAHRLGNKDWTFSSVTGGGSVTPSLAVSPKDGTIGVAYYDAALRVLRLAESTDAMHWTSQVVNSDGDVGRYSSLRYDQNGLAVAAYYRCGDISTEMNCDTTTDGVHVARRDASGNWTSTDVDDGGTAACGTFVSLALDPNGKAAIIYQCSVFNHQTGMYQPTVKFAHEQ